MYRVTIKEVYSKKEYKSKHKSDAQNKAIKKAYGSACRFMQNSGLPKGYGTILNHSKTCNVVAEVAINIEEVK